MKKRVPYQQPKIKKARKSTCKPFLFVSSIHLFGPDQTTKESTDNPEEIEQEILN
jgi:hypothetical protein